MSWTRQVWHVLSRDVRRTRWLLVAFLALIAVRVVELVGANRLASHPSALVLIAMYLTAPVLVVLWLQEDTPTDVQGFWTALPLKASAVVAAKVVGMLALIILPMLVGQGVVAAYIAERSTFSPLLLTQGSTAMVAVLCVIGVFASILRGLPAIALTTVGGMLAVSQLLRSKLLVPDWVRQASVVPTGYALALIGIVGCLSIVWFRYARRLTRPSAAALGTVAFMSLAWSGQVNADLQGWGKATPTDRNVLPLSLRPVRAEWRGTSRVGLQLAIVSAEPTNDLRVFLETSHVYIRFPDSSRVRSTVFDPKTLTGMSPTPPGFVDVTSRRFNRGGDTAVLDIGFTINRIQRQHLEGGEATLELEGLIAGLRERVLGTVSAERGALLRGRQRRVGVRSVAQAPNDDLDPFVETDEWGWPPMDDVRRGVRSPNMRDQLRLTAMVAQCPDGVTLLPRLASSVDAPAVLPAPSMLQKTTGWIASATPDCDASIAEIRRAPIRVVEYEPASRQWSRAVPVPFPIPGSARLGNAGTSASLLAQHRR